jgi:hypothetical protein
MIQASVPSLGVAVTSVAAVRSSIGACCPDPSHLAANNVRVHRLSEGTCVVK